jgi:hypothetical protein
MSTGNQIFPDTEMFERTLGLSAPESVGRNFNDAEAVRLFPHLCHGPLLRFATEFFQLDRSIASAVDAPQAGGNHRRLSLTFVGTP